MIIYVNDYPQHLQSVHYNHRIRLLNQSTSLFDLEDSTHECESLHQSNETNSPEWLIDSPVVQKKIIKKVRFETTPPKVMTVLGLEQMSRSEKKAVWYRKRDYKAMKIENDTLTSPSSSSLFVELSPSSTHSFRGLEHQLDKRHLAKKNRLKRAYFKSIMGEQTRQRMLGYTSDERLRCASQALSELSREGAEVLGRLDESFARDEVEGWWKGWSDDSKGKNEGLLEGLMEFLLRRRREMIGSSLNASGSSGNDTDKQRQQSQIPMKDKSYHRRLTLKEVLRCHFENDAIMDNCSMQVVMV